jgi:hypothetical protein
VTETAKQPKKKQKTRDFAALERRANHSVVISSKSHTQILFLASLFVGFAGFITLVLGNVILGVPLLLICCPIAAITSRDAWIHVGRSLRDRVLQGPSAREQSWSQRQTRIPFEISKLGIGCAPLLLLTGFVAVSAEQPILGSVWIVVTILSASYCFRAMMIHGYRGAVETLEAYQRDKERIEAGGEDE